MDILYLKTQNQKQTLRDIPPSLMLAKNTKHLVYASQTQSKPKSSAQAIFDY